MTPKSVLTWLRKSPIQHWPETYRQEPWGNSVIHHAPMWLVILVSLGAVIALVAR